MSRILTFWKLHRISILFTLSSLAFYTVFAYDLDRSDSVTLITLLAALTFFYVKLLEYEKFNFSFLVVAGLLFRLVFWVAEPNLSPDYFRFLWDGHLLLQGYNPYLSTPLQWMQTQTPPFPLAWELYSGMSELNAQHYSNYPPINQYIFAVSAWLGGKSVLGGIMALRGFILLAELGLLFIGSALLRKLNKGSHLIFWYFLNPMLIIELTGNLHFEGVMLLFLGGSLLLTLTTHWWLGAIFMALSIGTKLIPLMLLPLFLPLLGLKRSVGFYTLVGAALIGFSYPLLHFTGAIHFMQTIKLWFSNFEFNAGLYNLAEGIANASGIKSWKFIRIYGAITPWITVVVALLIIMHPKMRQSRYWINGALGVLTVYYLLAAVLHPWYLAVPTFLCLFTRWRFMLWWSILVMLSYTAYGENQVTENFLWLSVEYITVFGVFTYEFFKYKKHILLLPKKFSA